MEAAAMQDTERRGDGERRGLANAGSGACTGHQPPEPPGRGGPRIGPAGAHVIMFRPHMRDIPRAEFPGGYGIRPMTLDDIGLWTDIERDAEPWFPIGSDEFRHVFGDELAAVGRRCFIITDSRGLGVGTISAWYDREYRGGQWGRIHWLAVRPAHQRKGLARAGLALAMRKLAQWHDRAMLATQTRREGAIRLYLDFGFVPDLADSGARAAWGELAGRMRHPALDAAMAE